ncbi:hypothetical protein [Chitinophaga rhizosphaerae]|uniref:hypothetical protein n=1 Tax=Chitinophaga rhizosphaerae TaxID=1864947 RepID=UPI000F803DC2|nr:hypothetical protein [Chitinophaga rhizosphaerae]
MNIEVSNDTFPMFRAFEEYAIWKDGDLPLTSVEDEQHEFVANSPGLSLLMRTVGRFSETNPVPNATNLYVSEEIMMDFDANQFFIEDLDFNLIQDFMAGVVCFGEGFQLVYMILTEEMATELLGTEDRYMATAQILGNSLWSFEEGVIAGEGLAVSAGTRFELQEGFGPGTYMAMTLSLLSAWIKQGSRQRLSPASNLTNAEIFAFESS